METFQKHVLSKLNMKKYGQKSQNWFVDFHINNLFGIAITDEGLIGNINNYCKVPTVAIKITTR